MSRLFAPAGESPDSSSECSRSGSPRSSPRPNRGVLLHNQGLVASAASASTGLQVNQPADNNSVCGAPAYQDLTVILQQQKILFDNYNTRPTEKSPVRQQNAWFDRKKPGSTEKCPVRQKNALPRMHQLTLPLSNIPPPPPLRNIFFQFFSHIFLTTNREMKIKLF